MMRCCCFLPCFGPSKRQKHLRSANANPTPHTHVEEGALLEPAIQPTPQKTVVDEKPIDCIAEPESKIENEEQSYNSNRAEVTSTKEVAREEKTPQIKIGEDEEESSESLFSLSLGSGKPVSAAPNAEAEVNSPMHMQLPRAVCTPKETVLQQVSSLQGEPIEKEAKLENTKVLEEQPQPSCIATWKVNPDEGSFANKLEAKGPVPAEYRYRDCSDEGYEGMINLDDDDDDPHNEKRGEDQQESSESLFSLSTNSRKRISSAEKGENEVSSAIPAQVTREDSEGRIPDVSSVLNPIENLTRGKVVKATVVQQPLKKDKENIYLAMKDDADMPFSPEPRLKLSNRKARQKMNENENEKEKEIGVDTSFSSWLVESETTPISMSSTNSTPKGGRGSPFSHEDRPILGALTIEEIRKYSVSLSASSRRSRSRSPDETPIIGTVGSYWCHAGQRKSSSMSSKFNNSGKDVKPNWSSTTVKTRLEPAFEASVAEI